MNCIYDLIEKEADTSRRYGFLWQKCRNKEPRADYHFNFMQEVIPEKIVRGVIGLELGCGSGWDTAIMAKNNPGVRIIGLDISEGVYEAAKQNNYLRNVFIIQGSISDTPLKNESFDFIYSFGVLHHLPDYKRGFLEMARVLKSGCPCFLYLYEDHRENSLKYYGIKMISLLRRLTVKIPLRLLYLFSFLLSPFIVIFFSYPAKLFKKFKSTYKLYENMPFNFGKSLFSLTGDLYDRFSALVEHRFNQEKLLKIFSDLGFHNTKITKLKATAGWVVWGYKGND